MASGDPVHPDVADTGASYSVAPRRLEARHRRNQRRAEVHTAAQDGRAAAGAGQADESRAGADRAGCLPPTCPPPPSPPASPPAGGDEDDELTALGFTNVPPTSVSPGASTATPPSTDSSPAPSAAAPTDDTPVPPALPAAAPADGAPMPHAPAAAPAPSAHARGWKSPDEESTSPAAADDAQTVANVHPPHVPTDQDATSDTFTEDDIAQPLIARRVSASCLFLKDVTVCCHAPTT